MYTEEYDKRPFPFRDFLLKFIVIVIFVLLLIWLIPKFTKPKAVKETTASSEVFASNLNKMKDAAVSYYNKKDKMPEESKKEVMTLRQMVNQGLLSAFKDKDGKACNVDKSYVQVTAQGEEYLLKINLKCENDEDYLLTKLGSYSYCEGEICEKDLSKTEKEETPAPPSQEPVHPPLQEEEKEENPPDEEVSPVPNTNSNEPSPSPKTTLYEYVKELPGSLSSWTRCDPSIPSDWKKNSNRLKEVTCNENDTNCLKQVKLYRQKELLGTTSDGTKLYGTVVYYCIQTRTYTKGSKDTKWSANGNDTALINDGYKNTGRTKTE